MLWRQDMQQGRQGVKELVAIFNVKGMVDLSIEA